MIPLQQRVMAVQFKIRRKSNVWTDQRAKTILEVLGAMRVVKYFSYEVPFLKSECPVRQLRASEGLIAPRAEIYEMRKHELKGIKTIQFARSAKYVRMFG